MDEEKDDTRRKRKRDETEMMPYDPFGSMTYVKIHRDWKLGKKISAAWWKVCVLSFNDDPATNDEKQAKQRADIMSDLLQDDGFVHAVNTHCSDGSRLLVHREYGHAMHVLLACTSIDFNVRDHSRLKMTSLMWAALHILVFVKFADADRFDVDLKDVYDHNIRDMRILHNADKSIHVQSFLDQINDGVVRRRNTIQTILTNHFYLLPELTSIVLLYAPQPMPPLVPSS